MSLFPKLLYAHRGACLKLPENTLEAFEVGLIDGANALELDVHKTRDGVIVVIHDPDGKRVAGVDQEIKELTYEQISGWKLKVPTFRQVLEKFKNVPVNVDIKDHDPGTVRAVVQLVMDLDQSEWVRLTGESKAVTKLIKQFKYPGLIGMGMGDIAALKLLPKWMIGRKFAGRAAQVPMRYFIFNFATARFVRKCHELGVRVDYWVVNDLKSAHALAEIGADGIMSDDPGSVKDWLKEGPKLSA